VSAGRRFKAYGGNVTQTQPAAVKGKRGIDALRRPRGMYLSLKHKGRIEEVLRNWPAKDVRVICAASGGRILGLGDLGANGMGIPIGKLQLYTACAAVPPQSLLPIHIDCGTTNEQLIDDPLYLGLRQPRGSPEELEAFVDEFVDAVQRVFPGCCIHFEDWAGWTRCGSWRGIGTGCAVATTTFKAPPASLSALHVGEHPGHRTHS
jgi:hypothetical protein